MGDLKFEVDLSAVGRRQLRVRLTIQELSALPVKGSETRGRLDQIEVFLPVWTPGSYLVREFSRHLRDLRASDEFGAALPFKKSSKNRWLIQRPSAGSLRLDYTVYAHELTVRTAYATPDFAFWNGACVYLWPVGCGALGAEISVSLPPEWRLFAGSTQVTRSGSEQATFRVADHAEAVDTPCLAGPIATSPSDSPGPTGPLVEWSTEVAGCTHRFVEAGGAGMPRPGSFRSDVEAVLRATAAVFGGELPFRRYTFLALFGERARGGLEHCDSSTLLAPRTTFAPRSAYEDYLSLIAHEYLHVWNVKRMRPREFWDYDLEVENHTRLLWVAEGFTAYLDDHLILRANVMSARRYLTRVSTDRKSVV